VLGFQVKSDAERFWAELTERFRKFALELHPDKTRLLEFGPFAVTNRKRRGEGKPETFNFLEPVNECEEKVGLKICYGLAMISISLTRSRNGAEHLLPNLGGH
jgi:RNA-directed DNA polymerase